jgi:hypothetical protein
MSLQTRVGCLTVKYSFGLLGTIKLLLFVATHNTLGNWTCWITVEGKTELQITITVLATHYFLFFTHSLLSISVLALLVEWS